MQESTPVSAEDDPILTLADAAKQMGVHRTTVSRWIAEKLVVGQQLPKRIGIRQSEVNRWIGILEVSRNGQT